MGCVASKQAAPAGDGALRSDWKARLARAFSRSPANREGKSPDGRAVKVMPLPGPAARRTDTPPDSGVTPTTLPSRTVCASSHSSSGTPAMTPKVTPKAQPSPFRPDSLNSALSPRLLPMASSLVEEGSDEWFQSLSPAQAAHWIRGIARERGGATMDAMSLDMLCVEIGLYATELGVVQMQAMGQALAQVFNPPVSAASSSSSALAAALASPSGYQGLARLVKAMFAHLHQTLRPEQAGAFIEGMRLSLPPVLPGADAVFRRAICEVALADAPKETVIAMACGMFAAMVDPKARPMPHSRANLPPGLPVERREEIQEALDMGKRLALQPCSALDKDVKGAVADRLQWLMVALRMPRPLANEDRFPLASRNYLKAVQRLTGHLRSRDLTQVLAAVNQARGQGTLRGAQDAAQEEDRKAS